MPFLLVAFAVLYPVPTDTGRLFAWPIKPTLTAMVLASAYLGDAYFFLRAGSARSWQSIKAGFPPVTAFATLLGIATILHWNKFLHTHVAFWLWAGLYFTTPFLVFLVRWRNRGSDPAPVDGEVLLPRVTAWLIGTVGGLAALTGALLFVVPGQVARVWPWTLTPLTARVLGEVFCLGSAAAGAPADRRWRSARVPFEVACLMLALMVAAGLRARHEFSVHNVLTWLFAVGFNGTLVGLVAVYLRMEMRTRAGR